MAVLVQDTFTASDFTSLTSHTPDVDAAGGGWQVIPGLNGSLTIHTGFAVALGASNAQQFGNYIEVGTPNIKATWTVVLPNANVVYPSRFVFRYVDADNYLAVDSYPTANAFFLVTVKNGAASLVPVNDYLPGAGVQGLPIATSAGAVLTNVTVIAEDTDITIQYGDEVLTYHGITDHLTGTKCGLLGAHRSAGPTSFDNLTIETVPARTYGDPQIWLRADEGAFTIAGEPADDGEQVALWLDKSNRGHSAINHLQPERPYFDADGYDGDPAIYFPGAGSQNLQYALPASKDDGLTVFLLLKVPSGAVTSNHNDPMRLTTRPTGDGSSTTGGGNNDDRFMFAYYAEDNNRARLRNMEDGSFIVDYLSDLSDDDEWHLVSWSWDFNSGSVIIRVDGETVHTQSSLPPPDADYAWGGIGSALGGAYAIECWIREFRGYAYGMDASQMEAVEAQIIAGVEPSVYTLTADPGSFSLSGQAAGLIASRLLPASAGSYAITGQAAGMSRSRSLPASTGSFSIAGQAAALLASRVLPAAVGQYAITGQAASLLRSLRLPASAGSFAISGQAAGMIASRLLPAAAGVINITGQSAGFTASHILQASPGSYAVAGQAAGLTAHRVLVAAVGHFTLTGFAADLWVESAASRTLVASAGVFIITGQPAGLTTNRQLQAAGGSFAMTGMPAGLALTRRIETDPGVINITGQAAALTVGRLLVALAGSFALRGFPADLRYSGEAVADSLTLAESMEWSLALAESQSWALTIIEGVNDG